MNRQEREELVAYYRAILEEVYGDKPWIVATGVFATMTGFVRMLDELGADKILCVASSEGAGVMPDPTLAPDPIILDVQGGSLMTSLRMGMDAVANLSKEHRNRIDAFDPEHRARSIGAIFDDGRPVAGRTKFGGRPPEWLALEDKMVVDAIWDACSITRAPSKIVDADRASLLAAASELDQGLGTIWVGDNREGHHGGGEYLRWVRRDEDRPEALEFFAEHCDRVRVMPFLEGIPCSVHGFVFPDTTITLRPCEMLVMRRPDSNRLHYSSTSTFWDPSPEDREQMREVAHKVGEYMREAVDYRGTYTVDGIMTRDGFRPTEINPRFGAALNTIARSIPDLPLILLNMAIIEEFEERDWRAEAFGQMLLEAADGHRAASAMAITETPIASSREIRLVWDDGAYHIDPTPVPEQQDGEDPIELPTADVTVVMGPNPVGGYVGLRLDPEHLPEGASIAPRVTEILAMLDREYALGIGPLEPAKDVRRVFLEENSPHV